MSAIYLVWPVTKRFVFLKEKKAFSGGNSKSKRG
jgi:hypothetical protein